MWDIPSGWFITLILVLGVWEAIWKGIALWRAARNNHTVWYVCIIIFNTIGILPIVYLLIQRNKPKKG